MTRPASSSTAGIALAASIAAGFMACGPDPSHTGDGGVEPGASDARAVITVPSQARDMVRGEMRQMLSALNGVLTAVGAADSAALARAARSGGMAVAVDTDPALADRLPDEFKQLGVDTHRAFDAVAEAAEAGASVDTIAARLGRLTANCVACHESYRLKVDDPGD